MAISEKWGESSIVYITPLRALNRDIDRRLPELFKPLNLKVALRHGDTLIQKGNDNRENHPIFGLQLLKLYKLCY